MEDKEWVLKNVEDICADTRDVDEVCVALEHSTIFATEMIQNLTQTMFDLQQELFKTNEELFKANDKLNEIEEYLINYIEVEPEEGSPYAIKVEFKEILEIIKGDEDK